MGFFKSIFSKKQKGHILTDEDREAAANYNSLKWEFKRKQLERDEELQRLRAEREQARLTADINRFREEAGESQEESGGNEDLAILTTLLANARTQPVIQQPQPAVEQVLVLSDDELDKLLASIPKPFLKAAKTMPPETLKKIAEQKLGGKIDADTFGRAINKLKA